MDGLLGGNWIRSGESIFYCLVQHLFAVFALRLIADLRYELLRFLLRFILRHFHRISNISGRYSDITIGRTAQPVSFRNALPPRRLLAGRQDFPGAEESMA